MANSPASTFSLEEEGGLTLELRERALPYKPLTITGTQRAEFTWYPGSPQATVQMLGPEEGTITLNGFWKDRFIQGTDMAKIVVNSSASQAVSILAPNQNPDDVKDLVRLVDLMRRSGRLITLTWDSLVRYGHIISFTQTWHNTHDCEWSMDFAVVSQEPLQIPVSSSPQFIPAEAAVEASVQANQMQVLANNPQPSPEQAPPLDQPTLTFKPPFTLPSTLLADQWRAQVEAWGPIAATGEAIQWFSNSWANLAAQANSVVQFPGNLARDAIALASNAVSQMSRSSTALFDSAITEIYAVTTALAALGVTTQDQVPFGLQLGAKNYLVEVNNIVRSVRTSNAWWRYQYQQEMQGQVGTVFVAPADMDLRDVSRRFYGTQDNWQMLMLYNEFTDSKLFAGQEVRIPADAPYGSSGSTGGGGAR